MGEQADRLLDQFFGKYGGEMRFIRDLHLGNIATSLPPNFKSVTSFIEKVVFNDPYTIVKWKDGTKTIVKVMDGDEFIPETGVAVAICRKIFGSRADFKRFVRQYVPKEKEINEDDVFTIGFDQLTIAFNKVL